jgi:hypothetical protein
VTLEIEPKRRVLSAIQRLTARLQCVLIGIRIHLLERHRPVLIAVGGTPQARHEVVGEERALQRVGLLSVFVFRAGGEERDAFTVERGLERDHEGGDRVPAFHARERARAAGVHDQDAEVGGRALHEALQERELQRIVAQVQRLGVGVARVIDEEHGVAARALGADSRVERDQHALHLGRPLVLQ